MVDTFFRFDGPRGGGRPPQGGYQAPPSHSAPQQSNGYGPPSYVLHTSHLVLPLTQKYLIKGMFEMMILNHDRNVPSDTNLTM